MFSFKLFMRKMSQVMDKINKIPTTFPCDKYSATYSVINGLRFQISFTLRARDRTTLAHFCHKMSNVLFSRRIVFIYFFYPDKTDGNVVWLVISTSSKRRSHNVMCRNAYI